MGKPWRRHRDDSTSMKHLSSLHPKRLKLIGSGGGTIGTQKSEFGKRILTLSQSDGVSVEVVEPVHGPEGGLPVSAASDEFSP